MMKHLKLLLIVAAIVTISANSVTIPAAGLQPGSGDGRYQNLKVLPENISEHQLDSVMDHFKVSLGVKCSFCHAVAKDTSLKGHLDFTSDEKPEKLRARDMLRMTAYLNENYFNPNHSSQPDTIHEVICYTCHRGTREPDAEDLFMQVDSILKASRKPK